MAKTFYQHYRDAARKRIESTRRVKEQYAAGDFKEELHDRDEGGQFTSGGGSGGVADPDALASQHPAGANLLQGHPEKTAPVEELPDQEDIPAPTAADQKPGYADPDALASQQQPAPKKGEWGGADKVGDPEWWEGLKNSSKEVFESRGVDYMDASTEDVIEDLDQTDGIHRLLAEAWGQEEVDLMKSSGQYDDAFNQFKENDLNYAVQTLQNEVYDEEDRQASESQQQPQPQPGDPNYDETAAALEKFKDSTPEDILKHAQQLDWWASDEGRNTPSGKQMMETATSLRGLAKSKSQQQPGDPNYDETAAAMEKFKDNSSQEVYDQAKLLRNIADSEWGTPEAEQMLKTASSLDALAQQKEASGDRSGEMQFGASDVGGKGLRTRSEQRQILAGQQKKKLSRRSRHARIDFKEELHDRDDGGKFTSGGGGGGAKPDAPAAEKKSDFDSLSESLGVSPEGAGGGLIPENDPDDCPDCLEQPFSINAEDIKKFDEHIDSLRPKTRSETVRTDRTEAFEIFFEAVKQHPYYKETKSRLESLTDEIPAGAKTGAGTSPSHPGRLTHWSAARHTDPKTGEFTEERKELHKEMLYTHQFPDRPHVGLLNPNADKKKGRNDKPVAVFLMGNPGSGKTSSGLPLVKEFTGLDPGDFTNLNADDVKSAMPEYEGWNAGSLHEESSWLVEGQATVKAVEDSHNIIFDLVGKNGKKMREMADNLHANGYEIQVIQTRLAEEESAARAWDRGRENSLGSDRPEDRKKWGRFVPPEYVYEDVDGKPDNTFEDLKSHPAVSNWSAVDTDIPYGSTAPMIDQGSKDMKALHVPVSPPQ